LKIVGRINSVVAVVVVEALLVADDAVHCAIANIAPVVVVVVVVALPVIAGALPAVACFSSWYVHAAVVVVAAAIALLPFVSVVPHFGHISGVADAVAIVVQFSPQYSCS